MYRIIRFLLIMSCLAVFSQAVAQFDDPQTLEVGPHVGVSYYQGDLNPMIPFAQAQLQYGGVVRFNYDNRWTFRFDYSRATVKADDQTIGWRPERGLNFTTIINDFSLMAEFNFLEYYTGNPKRNVSLYIFAGVSVFQYTPFAEYGGTRVNLRDYPTEAAPADAKWYETLFGRTSSIGVSIPFGFGVKFSLSKHIAATVEWNIHKTFTDYLDDVGTVYPEISATFTAEDGQTYNLSDPTGSYIPGQQRGNASFNDWFGMARVSLTWKFNMPDGRGCNLSKF